MRLINTTTYLLEDFEDADVPPYAILSHRWGDGEVTFQDYRDNHNCSRAGYHKIIDACAFARSREHVWLWIDTCCIDKRSSAELSEAINSMCSWYSDAEECIAFLVDVQTRHAHTNERNSWDTIVASFENSEWFTRGWTLQELIVPSFVTFCSREWEVIGVKKDPETDIGHVELTDIVSQITGVPEDVLRDRNVIRSYSIAQRLSWAAERETSRVEDEAYSLMGIFGVYMPVLYGERSNAFTRLLKNIADSHTDESIFAYDTSCSRMYLDTELMTGWAWERAGRFELRSFPMLAKTPAAFAMSKQLMCNDIQGNPRFSFASGLIRLSLDDSAYSTIRLTQSLFMIQLNCHVEGSSSCTYDLLVELRACGHHQRVSFDPPLSKAQWSSLFPTLSTSRVTTGVMYIHGAGIC